MAEVSSLCRKGAHELPPGPPKRITHCWGTARDRVGNRYVDHPCGCECHPMAMGLRLVTR